MVQPSMVRAGHQHSRRVTLKIFTRSLRFAWASIVAITITSEVMPVPGMPPMRFYLYCALKLVAFFMVGCLAPLAFWRFNALNRGMMLAAVSATFVESMQGLLHHGHSFHWYELLVKLALIFLGFALALDVRYEGGIEFGSVHITLSMNMDKSEPGTRQS